MSNFILKAENVHKVYPNGEGDLHILKGISLEIPKEGMFMIIGPSGAGKSTLLHILGGLDRPTEGRVLVENTDLYKINDKRRALWRNEKIGFVFQFYHLLPEFTALENVLLPVLIRNTKRLSKKQLYQRSYSLLDEMGLIERANHKPAELSGGEQQRVAVARALMNKPELLLCDEPTGNLDSENSDRLMQLLKKLNQKNKQTFLIVSHNEAITEIADKIYRIKDGMFEN